MDRQHQCNQYFAIRFRFIHEWQFKVVTLTLQPVKSHTSQSLRRFVKSVMSEYHKRMLLFNTTDGAANMKLLSQLLDHQHIVCTDHCLHLLLTADSFNQILELVCFADRCKAIVDTLHFKGHVIRSEQSIADDIEMLDRVDSVVQTLSIDSDKPVTDTHAADNDDEAHSPQFQQGTSSHQHHSLKTSLCARWNSTLTMIESILDLRKATEEAMNRIGKSEKCLEADDVMLLEELCVFLSKFRELSDLVSECQPNLSLIPLLHARIQRAREYQRDDTGFVTDSAVMQRIKTRVCESVNKRIKTAPLVKLASCFDMGVRRAALSNEECLATLRKPYETLKGDNSPVRHHFCHRASVQSTSGAATESSTSVYSEMADGDRVQPRRCDDHSFRYLQQCRIAVIRLLLFLSFQIMCHFLCGSAYDHKFLPGLIHQEEQLKWCLHYDTCMAYMYHLSLIHI